MSNDMGNFLSVVISRFMAWRVTSGMCGLKSRLDLSSWTIVTSIGVDY